MSSQCPTCSTPFTPSTVQSFRGRNTAHMLRSNTYPFDNAERVQLSALIVEAGNDLKQYNVEIAKLERKASMLRRQRNELQNHVDFSRSLLSPIRKIPRDVLVEIFLYLNSNGISVGSNRINVPFLNASQICVYWRKVIHDTKSLWTPISITALPESPLPSCIFEYAGDADMNIYYEVEEEEVQGSRLHTLSALFATSNKWKMLNLASSISGVSLGGITRLEDLQVRVVDTDPLGPAFRVAPSLKRLSIWLVDEPTNPNILDIPWQQLQHLTIGAADIQEMKKMLSQGCNIETLEVRFCYSIQSETAPSTIVHDLSSLVLCVGETGPTRPQWTDQSTLPAILGFLTLPKLRTFELCMQGAGPTTSGLSNFKSMLMRSNFTLRFLTLKSGGGTHFEYLMPFLLLLTSLVSLDLRDYNPGETGLGGKPPSFLVSDYILGKLQVRQPSLTFSSVDEGGGQSLLPMLQYISFTTWNQGFSLNALVDMVMSRWIPSSESNNTSMINGVSILKKVELNLPRNLRAQLAEEFRSLELLGLDYTLTEFEGSSRAFHLFPSIMIDA